jgi:hypothetical protein
MNITETRALILQKERAELKKKYVPLLFAIAVMLTIIMVSFSATGIDSKSLACSACDSGIVNKTQCEAFVVKMTFKNTGESEGSWSVNVALEGDSWSWSGASQNLTLTSGTAKTLIWKGNVPCNATVGSMARLIVYHDDSFTPLNWWIHVIPGAELSIVSSILE